MQDTSGRYVGEKRCKKIFFELVELQDQGMSPRESRLVICKRYKVPANTLTEIEDTGIALCWPPLIPEDEPAPRSTPLKPSGDIGVSVNLPAQPSKAESRGKKFSARFRGLLP